MNNWYELAERENVAITQLWRCHCSYIANMNRDGKALNWDLNLFGAVSYRLYV